MSTLRGKTPKDTFNLLLKLSEPLSDTTPTGGVVITDGDGNEFPIKISHSSIEIGGTVLPRSSGSRNSVLTIETDGSSNWNHVRHGHEKFQTVEFKPSMILPSAEDITNYQVTVSGDCVIALPTMEWATTGDIISVSIRVDQTSEATITWDSEDGFPVKLSQGSLLSGANKTTIFSFIYYKDIDEWIGGVIWAQS